MIRQLDKNNITVASGKQVTRSIYMNDYFPDIQEVFEQGNLIVFWYTVVEELNSKEHYKFSGVIDSDR